jgi:DNA (cytosine-5)-methyltransferase 1
VFVDLIEEKPLGVRWHTADETRYLMSLMSEVNLRKVESAKALGRRVVGGVYRRTRPDEHGEKRQRAEIRFDDVAGCLRTPRGGSSRQTIMVVDGVKVRSRLLSAREAARLMGLDDTYVLPKNYNDAYHVCGDGVATPVVRYIAEHVLEPILQANHSGALAAAE